MTVPSTAALTLMDAYASFLAKIPRATHRICVARAVSSHDAARDQAVQTLAHELGSTGLRTVSCDKQY